MPPYSDPPRINHQEEVEARAQAYMRNAPVSAPAARKSSASSVQAASSMAGDEAVMADPVKGTQVRKLRTPMPSCREVFTPARGSNAAHPVTHGM